MKKSLIIVFILCSFFLFQDKIFAFELEFYDSLLEKNVHIDTSNANFNNRNLDIALSNYVSTRNNFYVLQGKNSCKGLYNIILYTKIEDLQKMQNNGHLYNIYNAWSFYYFSEDFEYNSSSCKSSDLLLGTYPPSSSLLPFYGTAAVSLNENSGLTLSDIPSVYLWRKTGISPYYATEDICFDGICYYETTKAPKIFSEVLDETSFDYNNKKYIVSRDYQFVYPIENFPYDYHTYYYSLDNKNWHNTEDNVPFFEKTFTSDFKIYFKIVENETGDVVLTDEFEDTSFSKLNVVTSFNSATNGSNLYSINVLNTYTEKNIDIPFKFQLWSNDMKPENIPVLQTVYGYYYNKTTGTKTLTNDVSVKDLKCDYSAYSTNEVVCTGVMTKKNNEATYYEFIFENADNYQLFYYDNLPKDFSYRTITMTKKDFVGYTYYKFPSNSSRMIITKRSNSQELKKGSIVFPFYYTINENIDIHYKYLSNKDFVNGNEHLFSDNYYYSVDFDLSNEKAFVVGVKHSRLCADFENTIVNYDSPLLFFDNLYFNFRRKKGECKNPYYEYVGIYVSNEFQVTFNDVNNSGSIVIPDDDGNSIIITPDDIQTDKDFDLDLTDMNSLIDSIKNYISSLNSTADYFQKIVDTTYGQLPSYVKTPIFIVYLLLLLFVALKLGGWST